MIRFTRAARALLLALRLAAPTLAAAENTWDYSVQVTSSVQTSPPSITLNWPQHTNGTPISYAVFRKDPKGTAWPNGVTLSGATTSYVDTRVEPGRAYEYCIVKRTDRYIGYGYIQTAIHAPLVDA